MKRLSILAVAALAVSILGLSGCQSGPSIDELIREDISTEFDSMKSGDSAFAEGIRESAGEEMEMLGIDPDEFTQAFLDGFDYEITGIDVDDEAGEAVAHVTMTCKSLNEILAAFETAFEEKVQAVDITSMTEDEFYKLGGEVMMQAIKDSAPREVDLDLKYIEGEPHEWNIDDSAEDELIAAMTG